MGIAFITVALEGSVLVRYITKFTEEIFSCLISCIFIFETFNKLTQTFIQHPLKAEYPIHEFLPIDNLTMCTNTGNGTSNGTSYWMTPSYEHDNTTQDLITLNQPNTALLTTILMLGTFMVAYFLRIFKNSTFFSSNTRRIVKDTYTQKLNVPSGLSPTDPTARNWLINPMGTEEEPLKFYLALLACIPAALMFVLIFMEAQITEMIVSKKENNLKKGTGYHLDLLVVGLLNALLPIFGMPWVVTAHLRSVTHTASLTIMKKNVAPGDSAKIQGVHEQRVTVVVINALLGLSILMQPLLKEIPLAVLFGIFLYMGVMSLNGVDLITRLQMMFMAKKNFPDHPFVHMVAPWRINVYTIIQLICLAILWAVKSTIIKISFPFMLVLTIPLRRIILPKFFTKRELTALDD